MSLYDLLASSEFESFHRSSLVKCAIDSLAFDVDWDAVLDEAENQHELFFLYDYETGRV